MYARQLATCSFEGRSADGRQAAWQVAWMLPLVGLQFYMLLDYAGHATVSALPLNALLLIALLATASYTDFRWKKIPNWATYPAVVWGLLLSLFVSLKFQLAGTSLHFKALSNIEALSSLAGCAVGLAVLLAMPRRMRGGAGDVKLAAAIGALSGPVAVVESLAWGYLATGLFVVVRMSILCGLGGFLRLLWRRLLQFVAPAEAPHLTDFEKLILGLPIPMAPFMSIGVLVSTIPLGDLL